MDHAEFIVSVSNQDDRVYRVFNNTFPVKVQPAQSMAALDVEGAYDAAWYHLRAQSDLGGAPKARLVYTPEGEGFRLNYVVDLALSAPDGAWSVRVDATSGAIISVEDTRLIRKVTDETLTATERLAPVAAGIAMLLLSTFIVIASAQLLADWFPLPAEVRAARPPNQGGLFVDTPQTLMAWGAIYFSLMTICEVLIYRKHRETAVYSEGSPG